MGAKDQARGMFVTIRAQMLMPNELTPKPVNMARMAMGTFIQNRPKAFDG
jgi:hypothetical protein